MPKNLLFVLVSSMAGSIASMANGHAQSLQKSPPKAALAALVTSTPSIGSLTSVTAAAKNKMSNNVRLVSITCAQGKSRFPQFHYSIPTKDGLSFNATMTIPTDFRITKLKERLRSNTINLHIQADHKKLSEYNKSNKAKWASKPKNTLMIAASRNGKAEGDAIYVYALPLRPKILGRAREVCTLE